MRYVTLEVDIDHGRVIPRSSGKLPDKASGLLTLFQATSSASPSGSISEFLEKWSGAFSEAEIRKQEDPRLEYLLGKHAK
jgi:hypothetical protein